MPCCASRHSAPSSLRRARGDSEHRGSTRQQFQSRRPGGTGGAKPPARFQVESRWPSCNQGTRSCFSEVSVFSSCSPRCVTLSEAKGLSRAAFSCLEILRRFVPQDDASVEQKLERIEE